MKVMTPRQRVMGLFAGDEVDRPACFSGMGNVITVALEQRGYRFSDLHHDPFRMAIAAASSYELFGFECAVVPYDLCVEAEALGCRMSPVTEGEELRYPTIIEKAIHSKADFRRLLLSRDLSRCGRVPVVEHAIRLLKAGIGKEVAVGTYLLGPYTLAGQLMDLNLLYELCFREPAEISAMLDYLADVIVSLAEVYQGAGADYICIREMGAATEAVSPRFFNKFIQPPLRKVFEGIRSPNVLHVCGNTNPVIESLAACGADAISVEQQNDLRRSRKLIGDHVLLFGNVDGYEVLTSGTPADVEKAVLDSIDGGVDGVWPSCDIFPNATLENVRAMVEATKKHGPGRWFRRRPNPNVYVFTG